MDATSAEHATLIESVRFHVPGHYGTGPEFGTFGEAVAEARRKIKVFHYPSGPRMTTPSVDVRMKVAYRPARGVCRSARTGR